MRNREKYLAAEEMIKSLLSYDKATGLLTWIKRPGKYSKIKAGDEAGCKKAIYILLKVGGNQLYAHIVCWFLATGKWPEDEIDHKNLDRHDNRFENLRPSTRIQNGCNRRTFSKTGKGLKGAFTHESMNGRWFAQIVVNKKQIYLGRFSTEEEAHAAYVAASAKHHGEFARAQ